MTAEQDKALQDADAILKKAFLGFYGNIQFNLRPGDKNVNVNVKEDKRYENPNKGKEEL